MIPAHLQLSKCSLDVKGDTAEWSAVRSELMPEINCKEKRP